LLYILFGEDDFSVKQALEEIKKGMGDPTAMMTNTTVLEGRQATPEQLRNASETVPFLADKRLVIVEGLLERFESKGRTGRKKTARNNNKEEEYKAIADSVKKVPEFTELVIIDGRISERNPLLLVLTPVARVRTFPLLKENQLRQWIERRVSGVGGKISPEAVNILIRFVGNNLWMMANEVDKLVLYCEGRSIGEEDVKAVVSYAREASVFGMVDAIIESRAGTAQELYQQMLKQGSAPAQLLVMLGRQVRIIYQLKEMRDRGKSRNEIRTKLGLTQDFVLRKAWAQADKYSLSRLKTLYHKLLETDIAIKTGKYDGELALSILIAELAQRGAVST
jgi:DNA polymerase-3 subunit delta